MKRLKLFLSSNDRYQRYSEISKFIYPGETVLDVGGGEGIISRFTNNDITVLDINKKELTIAEISGAKIIFTDFNNNKLKDGSYDVVVSVSALEHIPQEKRENYLKELKRISKKRIIIFTPTGSVKYDKILYRFKTILGRKDPWTKEHIQNGLPQINDLKRAFPNSKIILTQNAYVWLVIMFLQTIPIINKIFPGVAYVLLKPFNKLKPHTACILVSEK